MSKRGTSLRNNKKQLGANLQGVVYWRLRILPWPSIHLLVLDLTLGFLGVPAIAIVIPVADYCGH
jgi:hypothetical protein